MERSKENAFANLIWAQKKEVKGIKSFDFFWKHPEQFAVDVLYM